MKHKIDTKLIITLLLSSSLIGLVYNYFYPGGISYIRNAEIVQWADTTQFNNNTELRTPGEFFSSIPPETSHYISDAGNSVIKSKIQLINLEQTYNLFSKDSVVFIDARDKWDFAEGHIPGALNIPYYNFDKNDENLKTLPKDRTVVLYCGGNDCDASLSLAKELQKLKYLVLYVFSGGWGEWEKAGFAIEKSKL